MTAPPRVTAPPAPSHRSAASAKHIAAARSRAALRAIALVAMAAGILAAGVLAVAALLGGGSASLRVPAPASAGIAPLRVSSGGDVATGFAVAEGRVITVAHVLDGPVTVRGRPVRVLQVDLRSDLALLSAPGLRGQAPNITSATNGERLRVLRRRDGRLSTLSVRVRRSIVAHVRRAGAARARVRPALELAASGAGRVGPGDSGAAVVTDSGALAGIVFAASRNRNDTAYAVEASRLRALLRPSSVE